MLSCHARWILPVLLFPLAAAAATPTHPGAELAARQAALPEGTRLETWASGLDRPWSLAFLPQGGALVTERPGRLRVIAADGSLSAPVAGVPPVFAKGTAGLFDVVLHPDYANNHRVYLSYVETPDNGASFGTAVAWATLTQQGDAWQLGEPHVIFRTQPRFTTTGNYGGRLVFGRDGMLFLTLGDLYHPLGKGAQDGASLEGKVLRLTDEGKVPPDNPYAGGVATPGSGAAAAMAALARQPSVAPPACGAVVAPQATAAGKDAASAPAPAARAPANTVCPEIWSFGHRNPQGAALHPDTGALWISEHGPQGGDELNQLGAGGNFGWPLHTHGRQYDAYGGGAIGTPDSPAGFTAPLHAWVPSIAPSGLAFYTDRAIPGWQGSVFVGGLKSQELVRLMLDGSRIVGEERLLGDLGKRIRDVRQGPEGALYLLTDDPQGEVLRIVPAGVPAAAGRSAP